ncbi:MAG: hypothetical protein PHX93_03805 [Candidatus Peribacteraceae bacterium]|nr:hypothetical protein [Candidatus Peribacteraceae bacterium]
MAKHHDGLGVPSCLFGRNGGQSQTEIGNFRGGLGVPPEHLYPELSPEEARRRFQQALASRVPAEAEGEG